MWGGGVNETETLVEPLGKVSKCSVSPSAPPATAASPQQPEPTSSAVKGYTVSEVLSLPVLALVSPSASLLPV